MHYTFSKIYQNLNLFSDNPYMIYYHNIDGYDIFKISFSLRGMNSMFGGYDLFDLLDNYEQKFNERINKNGKDTSRFVYYFRKIDGEDGYFLNYLDYEGVHFFNTYDSKYIPSKDMSEKMDMDGVKAIAKIDNSVKGKIITKVENCPSHIEGDSYLSEYSYPSFEECNEFKYIGDNVISASPVSIKKCPNFTHIGKNFFSHKYLMIMDCDNFSKIKRGLNIQTLYVANCKNFDFDSIFHNSKVNDFRVFDCGFSNDILDMYEDYSLEEIDNFLSTTFPNITFKDIGFSYGKLYNLDTEKREALVNHFKRK